MTLTNKPVPQTAGGQRADGKDKGKGERGANAAGPADVAVPSDRDREKLLEDGSTEDGAAEVPSDGERGRGVSVNEAR